MPGVLLLLKADGVGGVERLVASLADVLADRGVEVRIAALGPPAAGASATAGLLADRDVTVLDDRGGTSPWRRVRQLVRWRRLVAAQRPVAVVAFGPSPSSVAGLARWRRSYRLVIAEMGDPFIPRRRRWNRWWMWTYRRADALVVPTERLAEEMTPLRRRPRELVAIPNVLAPQVPLADPDGPRQPLIVGMGRFVPGKRYGDLVEAFARLGDDAAGWRVVLLGEGQERAAWTTLAERLGVAGRIDLPGFHLAPWEVLADASVFVLCSSHEGFANVVVEAMASGCAVVASDCRYGPRDVLVPVDGRPAAGELYPVGDVEALTEHLRRLVGDDQRRRELARVASERALDFTPAAIGPHWVRVLGLDPPRH